MNDIEDKKNVGNFIKNKLTNKNEHIFKQFSRLKKCFFICNTLIFSASFAYGYFWLYEIYNDQMPGFYMFFWGFCFVMLILCNVCFQHSLTNVFLSKKIELTHEEIVELSKITSRETIETLLSQSNMNIGEWIEFIKDNQYSQVSKKEQLSLRKSYIDSIYKK